jgi:hypothetical protein
VARSSSFLERILSDAEARASMGPQGAAGVWADRPTLSAVLDGLKRPSSGSAYTAWASSSELRQAARVAAQLLSFSPARSDAAQPLQLAAVAAAQVRPRPLIMAHKCLTSAKCCVFECSLMHSVFNMFALG